MQSEKARAPQMHSGNFSIGFELWESTIDMSKLHSYRITNYDAVGQFESYFTF